MRNSEINDKLESLVGGRFSKESLNKQLSAMFGTEVAVEYGSSEKLPEIDDSFLFSIHSEGVDVDLYYLFTNAKEYYIVETNFENYK